MPTLDSVQGAFLVIFTRRSQKLDVLRLAIFVNRKSHVDESNTIPILRRENKWALCHRRRDGFPGTSS
jgi:hypothetical protein